MFEDGGVGGIVAEGRGTRRLYNAVTFRAIIIIASPHTMSCSLQFVFEEYATPARAEQRNVQ